MSAPHDRPAFHLPGFAVLGVLLGCGILAVLLLAVAISADANTAASPAAVAASVVLIVGSALAVGGFTMVQPNQARVLLFFGNYAGTLRSSGFFWVNPFTKKRLVSLRAHNFASEMLKVNDATGSPIEIAGVVVWRIKDPTLAVFSVEDYAAFVRIQTETAVRTLAYHFPYDAHPEPSLRGSPDAVNERLRAEVQGRLDLAGVEVMDARLSHLAYAPEIAQVMLRRQQAEAVIAARTKLVDGAVGMVEFALKRLMDGKVVTLDEERKAAMVNNLMVALVSEEPAQPVVNAGTMYP